MAPPDVHSTLREWLAFRPGLARVFTKYGVDLCRDAETSVTALCRERNLDPLIVKAQLDRSTSAAHHELGADWATAPLAELCQHLEEVHHAFYRRELPRLAALLEKVATAYAASHPHTQDLASAFRTFRKLLESHVEREERELFPAIRELMESRPPAGPHGLAGLINSLEQDHDALDAEFLRIRELTHGFVAPPGVCQTFQSLLDGLWDLEMNLHQNVYEENRFLFPRALRHEAALRTAEHAKTPGG
ncbi:MAG TPA: hemerythrin domain-containing protein [Pirellulales bacterium]|nr:hemerythrin domain-containing protein [Pirellulales bacterium]